MQVSKDKGNSWSNITKNFVNTPVSCISYDEASNTLFAGTDFGVFFSDADNVDWQYYGNNLPHTAVTDLKIHPSQRKLYISTYGRGFYSIDLPDCAPAVVKLEVAVNKKNFEKTDTLKICAGSTIRLKAQDSLMGSFRWRGPRGLDTTIINYAQIDLGDFSSIQQTGNYILEYVSAKGCARVDTLYIRVLNRPNLEIIKSYAHLDCNHEKINLKPSLGLDTVNFSYRWTSSHGLDTIAYSVDANQAGDYFLELMSRTGNCSFNYSTQVSKDPNPGIQDKLIFNNKCFGGSEGSLSYSYSGKQPFYFLWSNGDTSRYLNHLMAGSYYLTFIDGNNCMYLDTFTITQADEIVLNIQVKNSMGMDGEILSNVSGGTPPYKYKWFLGGALISESRDLFNLAPGSYHLEVSDANDCIVTRENILVGQFVGNENISSQMIRIYPNPTHELLTIEWLESNSAKPLINIYNSLGQTCQFNYKLNTAHQLILDVSDLIPGDYILKMMQDVHSREFHFTKVK